MNQSNSKEDSLESSEELSRTAEIQRLKSSLVKSSPATSFLNHLNISGDNQDARMPKALWLGQENIAEHPEAGEQVLQLLQLSPLQPIIFKAIDVNAVSNESVLKALQYPNVRMLDDDHAEQLDDLYTSNAGKLTVKSANVDSEPQMQKLPILMCYYMHVFDAYSRSEKHVLEKAISAAERKGVSLGLYTKGSNINNVYSHLASAPMVSDELLNNIHVCTEEDLENSVVQYAFVDNVKVNNSGLIVSQLISTRIHQLLDHKGD